MTPKLHASSSIKAVYLLVLAVVLSWSLPLSAQPNTEFRDRAKKAYSAAREAFTAKPGSFEAAWQLARACFDLAEFAQSDSERATLAHEGIDAAQLAVDLKADSPAGHFYLAMNKGQLARTKSLGALRLVKEMEQLFSRAAELNAKFEYAGADRSLGILYLEAPGWPTSIGNKSKARTHLKRALELVPDNPENHLCYMEALVQWEDRKELREAMRRYKTILSEAESKYVGENWEWAWSEWKKRWEKIQAAADSL